jgi:hypothetical protein
MWAPIGRTPHMPTGLCMPGQPDHVLRFGVRVRLGRRRRTRHRMNQKRQIDGGGAVPQTLDRPYPAGA